MITCLRPTPGQGPGRSRVQAFWLLFSMETGPPRQAGKKARHGEQKSLPRKVRASPCRSTLLIPERTVKGDLIDSGGKTDERVGVRRPWEHRMDWEPRPRPRPRATGSGVGGSLYYRPPASWDGLGIPREERPVLRTQPRTASEGNQPSGICLVLCPPCGHGDPERLGHSRFSGELTCPRSA